MHHKKKRVNDKNSTVHMDILVDKDTEKDCTLK